MKKTRTFYAAVTLSIMALSPLAVQADAFLTIDQVADSKVLIPTPPDTLSARFAYDEEQYKWGKSMRETPRGLQAIKDADLSEGWFCDNFSDAFGIKISKEGTPELYRLLRRLQDDAGDLATREAKNLYMRPRPFMFHHEPTSTPDDDKFLVKNGSYPSGHTAIGWSTALVLTELNPDRQNEILQRGFEFGQSRVIVGAHWQSDVDMGRVVGAAVVARLHAEKEFQKQLKKAAKEVKKARKAK